MAEDEILDPAHDDTNTGVENAGAAGIPKPEGKADDDKGPEFKASADGNIVEHNGKKYITEQALQAERSERQKLAGILRDLDPVMPEFEEFLKTRQTRRTATREAVASNGEPDEKEYLNDVAVAMGYYDENNQPDLRRAQAHLNINRREAERAATKAVEPLSKLTTRDRAEANRTRARANKFVDGNPIAGDKFMDMALNALDDTMMADDKVANASQLIAAGLEYLELRRSGQLGNSRRSSGGGARRSGEPMLVERGTGRFDTDDGEMSELDLAAARARGKSPEQWQKLAKKVNNASRLEDVG